MAAVKIRILYQGITLMELDDLEIKLNSRLNIGNTAGAEHI